MATFISTIKFTEQGLKNIKDTCKRADALQKSAQKMGVEVKEIYWTAGPFDGVILFDAPDEATATALMLHVGSLGNVHTQTTRAYKAAEMEGILKRMSG